MYGFIIITINLSFLILSLTNNFNGNKNQYYENLKLAINWDRLDVAEVIFTGEEEFKPNQLENLMEIALLKNKPKFVQLLLENGLNIKKFLTY